MKYHFFVSVAKVYTVKDNTALLPFIRHRAVSLMRMLPRPFACAVINLRNIAVFVNFRIDKLDITVIVFRLLIHKVEQTHCTC